ncbi:hypothetical protein A3Q56_01223 [Intoshia linei]|uniref:Uncharacterized protein n=1 Tax=Intoshia linei TaxID=1819745 RepID=A0A177B9R8_9BILA|nr:hypothetical protein A3Q56_01223 [Intoshia linei]
MSKSEITKPVFCKKCVVVGDGAVGKTSLLMSFSKDEFPEEYIPTVFETYVVKMDMDTSIIKLSFWDTAGQEDFDRLRMLSYPNTDVIVAVFSVELHTSYENIVDKWYKEVTMYCPNSIKLLVALKIDLRENEETIRLLSLKNLEPLKTHHTQQLCEEIKFDSFFECSAKSKEGFYNPFNRILGMGSLFKGIASMSFLVLFKSSNSGLIDSNLENPINPKLSHSTSIEGINENAELLNSSSSSNFEEYEYEKSIDNETSYLENYTIVTNNNIKYSEIDVIQIQDVLNSVFILINLIDYDRQKLMHLYNVDKERLNILTDRLDKLAITRAINYENSVQGVHQKSADEIVSLKVKTQLIANNMYKIDKKINLANSVNKNLVNSIDELHNIRPKVQEKLEIEKDFIFNLTKENDKIKDIIKQNEMLLKKTNNRLKQCETVIEKEKNAMNLKKEKKEAELKNCKNKLTIENNNNKTILANIEKSKKLTKNNELKAIEYEEKINYLAKKKETMIETHKMLQSEMEKKEFICGREYNKNKKLTEKLNKNREFFNSKCEENNNTLKNQNYDLNTISLERKDFSDKMTASIKKNERCRKKCIQLEKSLKMYLNDKTKTEKNNQDALEELAEMKERHKKIIEKLNTLISQSAANEHLLLNNISNVKNSIREIIKSRHSIESIMKEENENLENDKEIHLKQMEKYTFARDQIKTLVKNGNAKIFQLLLLLDERKQEIKSSSKKFNSETSKYEEMESKRNKMLLDQNNSKNELQEILNELNLKNINIKKSCEKLKNQNEDLISATITMNKNIDTLIIENEVLQSKVKVKRKENEELCFDNSSIQTAIDNAISSMIDYLAREQSGRYEHKILFKNRCQYLQLQKEQLNKIYSDNDNYHKIFLNNNETIIKLNHVISNTLQVQYKQWFLKLSTEKLHLNQINLISKSQRHHKNYYNLYENLINTNQIISWHNVLSTNNINKIVTETVDKINRYIRNEMI